MSKFGRGGVIAKSGLGGGKSRKKVRGDERMASGGSHRARRGACAMRSSAANRDHRATLAVRRNARRTSKPIVRKLLPENRTTDMRENLVVGEGAKERSKSQDRRSEEADLRAREVNLREDEAARQK